MKYNIAGARNLGATMWYNTIVFDVRYHGFNRHGRTYNRPCEIEFRKQSYI